MTADKQAEVRAYLKENPDATLKAIMEACGVSKPTAIKHRREAEDKEATPEGKGGGDALQDAFPPKASPPPPKPTETEVKAAKPAPREWRLVVGR
jgi:hypothetical protein